MFMTWNWGGGGGMGLFGPRGGKGEGIFYFINGSSGSIICEEFLD